MLSSDSSKGSPEENASSHESEKDFVKNIMSSNINKKQLLTIMSSSSSSSSSSSLPSPFSFSCAEFHQQETIDILSSDSSKGSHEDHASSFESEKDFAKKILFPEEDHSSLTFALSPDVPAEEKEQCSLNPGDIVAVQTNSNSTTYFPNHMVVSTNPNDGEKKVLLENGNWLSDTDKIFINQVREHHNPNTYARRIRGITSC